MQDKKLLEVLKNMGLSENESKVYLGAISLGQTTILKIAQTAQLKRTTVYAVTESLKQKGLIHIEEKGMKRVYVAEDPKKLEVLLENRKKELIELLPAFSSLYKLKESDSVIRLYEGFESIKTAYNMMIDDMNPHGEYLVLADQETWYNQDPKFFQEFMERRARLPIKIRMLLQDSPKAREHQKFAKNYNLDIKILPKGTNLNTDLVITPEHVMIQQLHQPLFALVIDNKSIIQMHKESFEIMWNAL